jgi:hypothetical protein
VISDFCRKADKSCGLLGYYTVSYGNSLPLKMEPTGCPFWILDPKDGTDRLSQNVDKKLPLLAAQ